MMKGENKAPLNIVVSEGEAIDLTTRRAGDKKVSVSAEQDRLRFDDLFARIVIEWRCLDGAEPWMHMVPVRLPVRRYAVIVEPGDEIRLTTMRHLFKKHVLVTERDGRLVVTGEQAMFSCLKRVPSASE